MSKKKKIVILSVVLGILVAIAILVAVFWDSLSNFWARNFMPAEDFYAEVEKSNIEDTVSKFYGTFVGENKLTLDSVEGTMKVEVGDSARELYELAGMEEKLGFLESVELSFAINRKGLEPGSLNMGASLNGKQLAELKSVVDVENNKIYLNEPDMLGDTYICVTLDDIQNYLGIQMGDLSESMKMSGEMTKALQDLLPSEEVAVALITKYIDTITAEIEDIERESETLNVNGVKEDVTCVEITLDGDTIYKVIKAVLTEAKSDDEIENILKDVAEMMGTDPKEFYEQYQSTVSGILAQLKEMDGEAFDMMLQGEEIVIKTYVSHDGTIAGRAIEVDNSRFEMLDVEDGSSVATRIRVEGTRTYYDSDDFDYDDFDYDYAPTMKTEEVEFFRLDGKGTKKDGKLNATYTIEMDETEYAVLEVKNFKADQYKENGNIDGEFYISLGEDLIERSEGYTGASIMSLMSEGRLGFVVKTDDNGMSLQIKLMGKKDPYLTLSIEGKKKSFEAPTMPSTDDTVNLGDEEGFFNLLVEDLNLTALIDKLEDAEIPEEYVDVLKDYRDALGEYETSAPAEN